MSVTVPNQTVAITRNDLPTPDFRRWQLAITSAVNTPVDATPVEPVSGDFLPLSTFVTGVDGIAFYGSLATGGVSLGLETLADSGAGALLGITVDAYGRVSGTTDATITGTAGEIDVADGDAVAGPPTLSLANTGVTPGSFTLANATFDSKGRALAASSNDAPSDGTTYGRKDGAWVATAGGGGSMTALGAATVSGTAATTMTLSGLDLSAYKSFLVLFNINNATASTGTLSLYYNGDTTATNYYEQVITGNAGASGSRTNSALIASLVASTAVIGEIKIMRDLSGYPRALSNTTCGTPAGIILQNFAHIRNNTANVTSVSLTSSVANALAIGSTMAAYGIS